MDKLVKEFSKISQKCTEYPAYVNEALRQDNSPYRLYKIEEIMRLRDLIIEKNEELYKYKEQNSKWPGHYNLPSDFKY